MVMKLEITPGQNKEKGLKIVRAGTEKKRHMSGEEMGWKMHGEAVEFCVHWISA